MCGFFFCRTTKRSSAEGLLEPAVVKRRRAGARERLKVHPAGEAALLPARAGAVDGGWGRACRVVARRPLESCRARGGGLARAGSGVAVPLVRGHARPRVRLRKFH